MEYEDVPYDADVVMRVLDDHDVPVKRLAMHLSLHKATVHKYLSGLLTIPSSLLKAVFELTGGDLRILGLITGTVPVTIKAMQTEHKPGCPNAQPVRIPPINELTTMSCKAVELMASSTRYLCSAL